MFSQSSAKLLFVRVFALSHRSLTNSSEDDEQSREQIHRRGPNEMNEKNGRIVALHRARKARHVPDRFHLSIIEQLTLQRLMNDWTNDPSSHALTPLLVEIDSLGHSNRSLDRHTGIQPSVQIKGKFQCRCDDKASSMKDRSADGFIVLGENEEPELDSKHADREKRRDWRCQKVDASAYVSCLSALEC